MDTKLKRFYTFIMKEKSQSLFSFAFYILFIILFFEINILFALKILCYILFIILTLFFYFAYLPSYLDSISEKSRKEVKKDIISKIKKITKEILMFIPIFLISQSVTYFIMIGEPTNQISAIKSFNAMPIFTSISAIIFAPIFEELIFRLLPYKFIKNKILYIAVSTVIFAAMHVIHDPNPFYYIWFYMIRPLYYGYRYHKTKDIWVTISIHSFNNLISILTLLL